MLVGFDKPAGLGQAPSQTFVSHVGLGPSLRSRGIGQASSKATIQAQITAAANQYNVPPALALAVAQQESGYQQTNSSGQTLTSSAGALGVMQLMPATAAGLGVDPTNQQQNIQGGVQLLSQLLTQFNGNVPDALAAYNAGPTAVIKAGGVPNIPETQNYVSSIMANYQGQGGGSTLSSGDTSASDTSGDTSSPDDSTGILASLQDAVSSVDLTDPTTQVILGASALGLLWVMFG